MTRRTVMDTELQGLLHVHNQLTAGTLTTS